MKRLASLALAAALLLALPGCGQQDSFLSGIASVIRGGRELRMNVSVSEDSVWSVAAETFKKLVEQRSRYRVRITYGEQLSEGDLSRGLDKLLTGETDVDLRSVADMQERMERLAVVSLPWLFAGGNAAVDEILFRGAGKNALFSLIREIGAEPLAIGENGFRHFTNNRHPVSVPSDFQGLRVRVPNNGLLRDVFQSMGAECVTMDWDAAFDALLLDELDGQENALDTIYSADVHKIQRYLTLWNCTYDPICLSVSGSVWESLTEEEQAVFRGAAEEACAAEVAASRALDAERIDAFEESGVEVTYLTEEQAEAFRVQTAALYSIWRERIGEDLFAAFGYTFY